MTYTKDIESIRASSHRIISEGTYGEFLLDIGINELLEDNFICDCTKNYGKKCLHPNKYRNGGCK